MAPAEDDVSKFIVSSGIAPWIVVLGAITLLVSCVFFAWKKKIVQNYWSAVTFEV